MSDDIYSFEQLADTEYTFTSIGRKGAIKKIVTFEEMAEGIYNVLLQDEVDEQLLGDMAVSNNGDPLKVINTTAAIIRYVLGKPPIIAVHIAGSTEQRSLAYQRRILRELKGFIILGQKRASEPFEPVKEREDYRAFLVLTE